MTIKQFIEKAIEGGWLNYSKERIEEMKKPWGPQKNRDRPMDTIINMHLKDDGVSKIFLDPKAWQAVGKVEGWDESESASIHGAIWKRDMMWFMESLIEGKTIEEYIKTL